MFCNTIIKLNNFVFVEFPDSKMKGYKLELKFQKFHDKKLIILLKRVINNKIR